MLKNCREFVAASLLMCGLYSGSARASQTIVQPESRYVLDFWGLNDGLPGSLVLSVTQTHDGYLWLATLNGLVRFDGVNFTVFDEHNTPGLDSSRIVSLFEDSRSNLWVGTQSAGVFIIDRSGQVKKVQTQGEEHATHPVFVCEDSDGVVWLLMKDGRLARYQNQKLEFVIGCKRVMTESNGRLWMGTDTGVYEIKASKDSHAFVVGQTIPLKQRLDWLFASRNGGFWVIADGHIQKWKGDRVVSDWEASPWGNTTVTTACEDTDGNLIVGTYGAGVYWFDSKGAAYHVETSSSYVESIMMDRGGSLWIGTDGKGLDRVKRKSFSVLPKSEFSVVQSVSPDHQGGLWIGYNGNHIEHWSNGISQQFTVLSETNAADISVRAVLVDKTGRVFAGVAGPLRYRLLELQGNHFLPVPGVNVPVDVSAIYEDRRGRIWIGTQDGLGLWDGPNSKIFSVADGLPAADVRAIADDLAGDIWIGTSGGLGRLHDGKITAFRKKDGLPSEDISSLLVDSEGVLWIGIRGAGLARFSNGRWEHYTTDEGLAGNSIGYLLEDGDYLWVGSNAGLTRVAKKSLNDFANGIAESVNARIYVEADGLPTRECSEGSQPAACSTTNGVLWFPTVQGVVYVDPSTLKSNSIVPPVVIESVSAQGQAKTATLGGSPARVIVPPGKGDLEIHYASVNPGAGARSRFRYRLNEEGKQSAWKDNKSGNRVGSYSKLPPGEYEFQVMACNEDGVWNPNPASLAIVVQPQLWQRTSFRAAVSAAALLIIGGLVYYFSTQKLQRQLALMRQQEALEQERGRIARDLHDQLGANLTQVALLAEMAESDKDMPAEVEDHTRQISQTARETTKALDEIVWAVNPSNDTLEGLVNYSGKYAQEYFALAGLRYRVDFPNQLPEVILPPEVRHNVFLAFKESVNNVVKHAQATEVHARLQVDEKSFTLEIEDNGRGLGDAEQKSGRNGLRNMRKRMEDVGGSFSIGPAAVKGTTVRLSAPIKNHRSNAH